MLLPMYMAWPIIKIYVMPVLASSNAVAAVTIGTLSKVLCWLVNALTLTVCSVTSKTTQLDPTTHA
jgi:hypothetical protein